MAQVNFPRQYVLNNLNVPPELAGTLHLSEWQSIRQALMSGAEEGFCIACGIEWLVCCLFSFPCIFCCHPCFQVAFSQSQIRSKISTINRAVFHGRPVVTLMNDMVIINTALIARPNGMPAGMGQMAYASAHVVQQPGPGGTIALAEAQLVDPVAAMQPNPTFATVRTMAVTVPQGATAGYTLKVTAPDGSTVSVVVPPNVMPGQTMTVQY